MTLNLLANILTIVFMTITIISIPIFFCSVPISLSKGNYKIPYIPAAVAFISLAIGIIFGISAKNTNVRVEYETIPIVKVTNNHYAIRKNGSLEYNKLPDTYQTTSGKSRIEKTKAIDWYLTSKNQDQIGKSKVYINNK